MALTEASADYTITTDSSYASSLFGGVMSRLGDFNGDGIDDFAVGSPNFGTSTFSGRVTIILGSATFSSLALPNTTRAITIDGPSYDVPQFGTRIVGIGHFYPGAGTTLIASAPGLTGNPTGTEGRIYAFRGRPALPAQSAFLPLMRRSSEVRSG